ncbi:hypothetical protein V9T40_007006 [Parthenolecanium corni]|uniref:Uncharacterized protein n=1 Tax=Parthenolecanium corni TaxID=536013 RepID=A0AAN9Y9F5_9HEMI
MDYGRYRVENRLPEANNEWEKIKEGYRHLTLGELKAKLASKSRRARQTGVNQGDSGGGLLFPKRDLQGPLRFYLRGITSNRDRTPRSDGTTYIAVFTDIAQHIDWMYEVREKIVTSEFNEYNKIQP